MKEPYYIVPAIEAYRKLDPGSEEARVLSRKIAANIGDYASLRLILGVDPPEFARFYPDMERATPSTFDTIDSFLEKYDKKVPEISRGEGIPYNIEIELWDSPLEPPKEVAAEKKKEEEHKEPVKETEEIEEPTLTQLIRNHKYKEALALIERQNLNNPQKSIYFAHQMRFLKKLIAIESYKQQGRDR